MDVAEFKKQPVLGILRGASAIAFGASVFKKEWLQDKGYLKITSAIKAYLEQLP